MLGERKGKEGRKRGLATDRVGKRIDLEIGDRDAVRAEPAFSLAHGPLGDIEAKALDALPPLDLLEQDPGCAPDLEQRAFAFPPIEQAEHVRALGRRLGLVVDVVCATKIGLTHAVVLAGSVVAGDPIARGAVGPDSEPATKPVRLEWVPELTERLAVDSHCTRTTIELEAAPAVVRASVMPEGDRRKMPRIAEQSDLEAACLTLVDIHREALGVEAVRRSQREQPSLI